jgi:Signal transduction histidine kinase
VNIAEKLTEVIEKSDYENLTINLKDNTEKNIVKVSHCINYAIEEIIDNGFCHNNSENKIINITIDEFDDDKIRIRFEDNGIGINEHEINVLKSKDETNHKHGSGSGLWLINWIINRSDGEVEFENISNGTRIEIILMKK